MREDDREQFPNDQMRTFAEWRGQFPTSDPNIRIAPRDVLLQLYTSGTTGKPKGALLTHRGLVGRYELQARMGADWYRVHTNDVSLIAMPVFHIGGTGWGLVSLYNGATGIVVPEFDALTVGTLIDTHKISKVFIVPSALRMMLDCDAERRLDYSSLRTIFYGSSPIQPELLQRAFEHYGCEFVQMYGLTETSGTIVALAPEDHTGMKMNSLGRPLPGVELAICDENSQFLSPGQVGEIVTRSIGNMEGYWQNAEATQRAFLPGGWLRTGDAGHLDEQGYLFIKDRLNDTIISGGENVYPVEVEQALGSHPDVSEVAVIGIPSEKWGEEVRAIVVRRLASTVSDAKLIAWARDRLAGFKVPKGIDFVDALPRNASGKVLRRVLREPFWKERQSKVN